jgi:hypothetical protein
VGSAATRCAWHRSGGIGASATRLPATISSVTAATRRAWHWPGRIGASATWLPATISSVAAAVGRARHWSARIGASAARRYNRLPHINCWPARSAVVGASARVVFILPRRRGRLRIVRSRLRRALPFKRPAAVRLNLRASWRRKCAPSGPRGLNRLTLLRCGRSESVLPLFRRGTAAHVSGWASATVEVTRAASRLKRCVLARGAAEEMLIAACTVWNRAGADLPVRRMETFTRRRHGVRTRHHAGLTE